MKKYTASGLPIVERKRALDLLEEFYQDETEYADEAKILGIIEEIAKENPLIERIASSNIAAMKKPNRAIDLVTRVVNLEKSAKQNNGRNTPYAVFRPSMIIGDITQKDELILREFHGRVEGIVMMYELLRRQEIENLKGQIRDQKIFTASGIPIVSQDTREIVEEWFRKEGSTKSLQTEENPYLIGGIILSASMTYLMNKRSNPLLAVKAAGRFRGAFKTYKYLEHQRSSNNLYEAMISS